MSFDEHDAKVGALLKKKDRAEKELTNRLCRAKQMVDPLRILADCFDDGEEDAKIIRVIGDRFECTHPSLDGNPNLVKKDTDWPEFPPDLCVVVSEICDLQSKIRQLSELLETELNCS